MLETATKKDATRKDEQRNMQHAKVQRTYCGVYLAWLWGRPRCWTFLQKGLNRWQLVLFVFFCPFCLAFLPLFVCNTLGPTTLLHFSSKRSQKVTICLICIFFFFVLFVCFFAFVCLQYFGAGYVAALFCKKVSTDDNWARRRLCAALRCWKWLNFCK